jgi:sugar phosphate isomerase/epimerase
MRRLLEPLSDTGLTVLVENGTRSHAPTSVELAVIMEHLTGLNCGALWDPGNAEFSGGSVGSVENNYDVIRPWLHHVHVKDPYYQSHYVKVGQGTVPWKRILNILNEERFAGWISLETHWRPDAALPRRLLDSPHGEEFSAGGVEASRQCLRVVIEMIQGENP